ncbi:unnamed protein product, partial [Arabidopsis halleri]
PGSQLLWSGYSCFRGFFIFWRSTIKTLFDPYFHILAGTEEML